MGDGYWSVGVTVDFWAGAGEVKGGGAGGVDGDCQIDWCAVVHIVDGLKGLAVVFGIGRLEEVADGNFCGRLDRINVSVYAGKTILGDHGCNQPNSFDVGGDVCLEVGDVVLQAASSRAPLVLCGIFEKVFDDHFFVEHSITNEPLHYDGCTFLP